MNPKNPNTQQPSGNSENQNKPKTNLETATDVGNKSMDAAGQFITKTLDFAERINQQLYGQRMKLFVGLSLLVVAIAPLIDLVTNNLQDIWTFWATVMLFLFLIVLTFAWIGSLRDDEGRWSFRKVTNRIKTYLQILYDYFTESIKLPREDMLYRLSIGLIIVSFCWKAMQNVSVFMRKSLFLEKWFGRMETMRSFEQITNVWAFVLCSTGIVILAYLIIKYKHIILKYVQQNFLPFIRNKHAEELKPVQISLPPTNIIILNTKDKTHMESIVHPENPDLFNQLIDSLQKWTPRGCEVEDDFQNSLHRQLKRNIPHASIDREYYLNLDEAQDKRKCRKGDLVINETILVEIKSSYRTTETDRAKSQIEEYHTLWKERGPIILLLCNTHYEEATSKFADKITSLATQDKKILTLVRPN